ncbi:MAG: hypothetical protein RIS75_18 [Actinomycetota bacterium]|jgi:hypothetical protein
MSARISLIGKPGCHLCDEARTVIMAVCAERGESWEEISILDHPELAEEYWTEIPVVLVDGNKVAFWRVSKQQIATALDQGRTVTP